MTTRRLIPLLVLFAVLVALLGVGAAFGQSASLLPNGQQQFLDINGAPLSAGTVTFYIPSTTTFKDTWTDPNEVNLNTNPVVLDAGGRATLYGSGQYRQIVKDVAGNLIWDKLTYATPGPGVAPILGFNFAVNDTAALVALDVSSLSAGVVVRANNYNDANRQFAPPVDYYLIAPSSSPNTCVVDNGSCFQSATGGYFWHIKPQTIWDPRWWGAYGDVRKKTINLFATSGSCTVTVGTSVFSQDDVNKYITWTNIIPGGGAVSASYEGQILGVTSGTQISVSPCSTANINTVQNIEYGHDDGAPATNQSAGPINAALQWLGAVIQFPNLSGQTQLNGGGLSYGTREQIVVGPQHGATPPVANGFTLANIDFAALGSANLPITKLVGVQPIGTGVMNITCAFCSGFHVHVDADYLPVNACVASSNGTIYWGDLRCNNWMGEGKSVTVAGAASTNASTFTAHIGACFGTGPYECIMTVDTLTSGKIQPGQGLSDCVGGVGNNCGVNVPAGTYIDGFKSGSGGTGTYSITNSNTNPGVVSSETMYGLSLNVTVPSCNSDNGTTVFGNNWPLDGSGNLLLGRMEISRGNAGVGISDRTFIVACKDATTAVLNKAPVFNLNNKSLTFFQEPNGFYMNGTALGSNYSTGLQLTDLTISSDSLDYIQSIVAKFGCALMDDSGGGTTIDKGAIGYGAAQICFGADHHNTLINHIVTFSGQVGPVNEINEPAALSVDGSDNIVLNQFEFADQLQFFAVSPDSNKNVSITNAILFANFARTNLAPNNTIWFYSGQTAAPSSHITIGQAAQNYNNPGAVNYLTFTTSALGGWEAFTPDQIADFSQLYNMNLALYEQPTAFGAGITTAGGPAAVHAPYMTLNATNYTFAENDSNTFFDLVGATGIDLTIPAGLSVSGKASILSPSSWFAKIFVRTSSGTNRVVPASGVIIWAAGASTTSPVTLTTNFEYELDCPNNGSGSAALCFLSKKLN